MKQIIFSSLYLIILFSISHFIFGPAHLYYDIWWLDIPMHILGGLGIASLVISILHYKNKKITLKIIILSVIVISLIWKVYEYFYVHLYLGEIFGDYIDIIKDVIDGLIGGGIAYLIFKKRV